MPIEASEPLDLRTLALLDQDISDSDLPIKVDVLDLAGLTASFRKLVEAQRVVLR